MIPVRFFGRARDMGEGCRNTPVACSSTSVPQRIRSVTSDRGRNPKPKPSSKHFILVFRSGTMNSSCPFRRHDGRPCVWVEVSSTLTVG